MSRPRRTRAILASDQAKAIRIHFLRDLTKVQLVEAFQEGFEANAKDKTGQKAAFDKMLALVRDVKEGETLTFTYLPGKSTTLQVGNKDLGVFAEKGFKFGAVERFEGDLFTLTFALPLDPIFQEMGLI